MEIPTQIQALALPYYISLCGICEIEQYHLEKGIMGMKVHLSDSSEFH